MGSSKEGTIILESAKLGAYISPACPDLSFFQLQEELVKVDAALEKVRSDLHYLSDEYGKLCDAINFYACLHNTVWREVKYEKFFGNADDGNEHMDDILNGFGAMGIAGSADRPFVYPRLPETNLFKPFLGAASSVDNDDDGGESDTDTYTS
uniref:Uncharacterized protein n=1 Tax=Panagrolaimus superbus TaxID=310955 RepID=A0A914Y2Q1_9BILA